MKRVIFRHIAILTLLASAAGCGGDDYDPNGSLKPSTAARYLSASTLRFDTYSPRAFSETFSVESSQTAWSFSDVASWFSLTPMSGRESASVTIAVEENLDANTGRTAIFYLTSDEPDWDFSRAMSVSQPKATPSLTVGTESISLPGSVCNRSVDIRANCIWAASCSEAWLSLSADNAAGSLSIEAIANPSTSYRTSYITISYGEGRSTSIKVTQAPSEITASSTTLHYYDVASRYDVTIDSEADWTAIASESWISVTPSQGSAGRTTVGIEVAPNTAVGSRTGHVALFTSGSERLQITVTQEGLYLEADQSLTFTSTPQSKELNVKSNTEWQVISRPEWLSLSKESGRGSDIVTATVTDNPNTTPRTGRISLGQPGLALQCDIDVTQQGKSLSTSTPLIEFSDRGGRRTFTLTADIAWTSSLTADWLSATPTSGRGDATIAVDAQENTSPDERSASILYTYADRSTAVAVNQQAKYLTINNQSFEFSSKGGTHTIDILTNDAWTIRIEPSAPWLRLSDTSGEGDKTVTLTVADNASVASRSTTVIIETRNAQSVRIPILQQPRKLSVSTRSIVFFADGGVSDPIRVETDGSYDINSAASWLTINRGEGDTFTVSATPNSSAETRRATITIALTDLADGALSLDLDVVQAGQGGSFIIDGYPEDANWNNASGGALSITINGYTSDHNWDDAIGNTLTINRSGYPSDSDWNKK